MRENYGSLKKYIDRQLPKSREAWRKPFLEWFEHLNDLDWDWMIFNPTDIWHGVPEPGDVFLEHAICHKVSPLIWGDDGYPVRIVIYFHI